MNSDELYIILAVFLTFLVLLAIHFGRSRERFAMPTGDAVYSDLMAEGRILRSQRYGITGKPDKIVQNREGVIPYEYKTTDSQTPREGHMLQMAAYFLILEENYPGLPVSYGVLKYRNSAFRIENSPQLREELFNVVDLMRMSGGMPDRNHESPRRCVYCSFREICPQKLIK